MCVLSLRQLGEELSPGYRNQHCSHSRHNTRRREHARSIGRSNACGPCDLCSHQHRRREWLHPRLCWRRPLHERTTLNIWDTSRRGGFSTSKVDALYLQKWLRASCRYERVKMRRSAGRSAGNVFEMANLSSQRISQLTQIMQNIAFAMPVQAAIRILYSASSIPAAW